LAKILTKTCILFITVLIIDLFYKVIKLRISRRKFFTLIGILGASTVLGGIYASIKFRDSISPLKENSEKAEVFIIGGKDRQANIEKLITKFPINEYQGNNIAIKANFNSDDPFPASTHIETLRAVVENLRDVGVNDINLAERSGIGNTRKVLENRGVFKLAKKIGFNVIVLDELDKKEWIQIPPDGIHWLKGFPIAKVIKDSDRIIQICCLKTHRFGGHFTMSLKNSVGIVAKGTPNSVYNYMVELHSSPFQRSMIAEINRFYDVDLAIMDAQSAFINEGPDRGEMVEPKIMLASKDRVALDAVGVAILRSFNSTREVMKGRIFEQEQIRRAVELGIGVDSPRKINLIPLNDSCQDITNRILSILENEG
jgi:uncharacterized protein (DUF362 family)